MNKNFFSNIWFEALFANTLKIYYGSYKKLSDPVIHFLNFRLEDVIRQYYDDEKELYKIKNDKKYIFFDKFFQRETGISLLEKYGFLKVLKKNNSKNTIN